ncbi:MAG TPA: 2-phosphosulfolactate phosphatase [Ktedonobacteraceae bacterium]|nr:2-phosphosulfolactate phosphatase [Ktedonobacteraceae bacterium]
MHLDTFFTPSAIVPEDPETNDIYIVIDVIRATTSMTVMFDQGAARVLVAGTVEQAREAASIVAGRLLCGERNVQKIPGFDYGNSPTQFAQVDLTGRELIMTTTNGTRAFYACPEQATKLAGCMYNAAAVADRALQLALEQGSENIHLVCSGELKYFALDDTVCAGFIAMEIQRQHPGIELWESALAAITLYEAYKPPKVLEVANSAQSVYQGGLLDDPPFCMQTNRSTSVPRVVGREEATGLLMLEAYS